MLPSVPWQLFDVVRSIILHIRSVKVSVYAISFIVWLAGLYLIYQTLGFSFGCFYLYKYKHSQPWLV